MKRRHDWAIRLARILREDFVDRSIEGRPIDPEKRELYLSLCEYAGERGQRIEPLPEFLKTPEHAS